MGYRSTVALVLSPAGAAALEKFMESVFEEDKDIHERVAAYFGEADVFRRTQDGASFYLWEAVKWYDNLPEYAGPYHVSRFLDDIFYMRVGISQSDYLFIRMGDDYDDLDLLGEFYENPFGVGIRREITFNS